MEWVVHADFTGMATDLYNCDLFFSCLLAALGLCLEEQQAAQQQFQSSLGDTVV